MIRPILLTPAQRRVYDFIAGYMKQSGISPTYVEIGKNCDIDAVNAHEHVANLAKKGALTVERYTARSIRLNPIDGACPCCGREMDTAGRGAWK